MSPPEPPLEAPARNAVAMGPESTQLTSVPTLCCARDHIREQHCCGAARWVSAAARAPAVSRDRPILAEQ